MPSRSDSSAGQLRSFPLFLPRAFSGRTDSITHRSVLPATVMQQLQTLIEAEWERDPVHACDGTAWSFCAYDSEGNVLADMGLRYIYGCPVLESIVSLLPDQWELIRVAERM